MQQERDAVPGEVPPSSQRRITSSTENSSDCRTVTSAFEVMKAVAGVTRTRPDSKSKADV